MRIAEAIRRIKDHNKVHSQKERNAIFITEALNMAVEALEKQIPKKPVMSGYSCEKAGNFTYLFIYDTYDCPDCHTSYEIECEKHNYCPHCGKRFDWSDESD